MPWPKSGSPRWPLPLEKPAVKISSIAHGMMSSLIHRYYSHRDDGRLREKWLAHLHRNFPPGQSKPWFPRFDNEVICRQALRRLGKLFPLLRRYSGFCLAAPERESGRRYEVWEMPGRTNQLKAPLRLFPGEMHPVFGDFLPSFSSRRSFVLQVPRGVYSGHDHVLFNEAFEVIDWEAPWWAEPLGCPGSMFRARLARPRQLPGRALVLAAPGAVDGNIWHYLFDSMPKIKLAQDAGFRLDSFDWVVVHSLAGKIERKVLERLGVPNAKVIEARMAPWIQAEELTFVTLGCLLPPDPWVLDWLRSNFLPRPARLARKGRKLFISRAEASRRRFLNEEPLRAVLESNGFETVRLETLGFEEQVAVMREAEAIVAPHGAGLTNLVWCEPGTTVVELFANEYVSGCYWAIAEMLQLQYFYEVGAPTLPGKFPARALFDFDRTVAPISFTKPAALAARILEAIG